MLVCLLGVDAGWFGYLASPHVGFSASAHFRSVTNPSNIVRAGHPTLHMTFFKGLLKKLKNVEEPKKKCPLAGVPSDINPEENWEVISELGDGAFGKVYKVPICAAWFFYGFHIRQ